MALFDSYGSPATGYKRTATSKEAMAPATQALATGVWPAHWLGGSSDTGGAPSAVQEGEASAAGGAISNTPIPVSWGQRRIVGKVIDHIVKEIDAEGNGAEILDVCAGVPLFRTVPNYLVKIVADGTTIFDTDQGGIIHPGVSSLTWYDGTSDAQIQDPTFVAEFGADVTPGYVGLMHLVIDFNSYAAWNNVRPGFTLFITDTPGGFGAFKPWGESLVEEAEIETLNPDDCSEDIELTNGNNTAERVAPTPQAAPYHWSAVRGTKGRPSNQAPGMGWFVFEARNDHVTYYPEAPVVIFPEENQGPGLASESFNIEGGVAGDEHSLYATTNGNTWFNSGGHTGTLFQAIMPVGEWVMFAVRLDTMKLWKGSDISSTGWYPGTGGLSEDPVLNEGGIDISYLSDQGLIFPAWFSVFVGSKGTVNLSGPFLNHVPGWESEVVESGMRNWGEVFIALAPLANLDPDRIVPLSITEESEGGIIYGGFSWTDVVSNAGKIANIDWWEDGQNIYIKQTLLDNPPTDLDGIPANHRYIRDEDQGSTQAERGAERRKPSVFELSYYDVSRQFQQSMVPARSEAHRSVTVQRLAVPFVMTAAAAATRSSVALGKSEMENEEHALSLPPIVPYIRLRPVDIVEFDEQDRGVRCKVRSWTLDSDWGVDVALQKLFTTSAEPAVPLDLEPIEPSEPSYGAITITSSTTFSVPENQSAVASLTASGGNGGPYTWTKTGGADTAKFNLSAGGVLTFATAPDFETPTDADGNNVYIVQVRAADSVGSTAGTQTISVTVTNVADEITITSSSTFSAAENQTAVATLTATGAGGGPYTWTKVGGADAAKFTLTSGGVLSFTTAPDYEIPTDADGNNVYIVQVRAAVGAQTGTQTISVTVTDVAELPVTITSPGTFGVVENTTAVGTLTASGGNGGPYTWAKVGGADTAKFTLTSGGVLTFISPPDFEVPTDADANNIYLVQVTASDGILTSSPQTISVTVTDVSELMVNLDYSKHDNSGYIIFFEDI